MTVTLVLPYPISANRYWASRIIKPRSGPAFVSTYVTPEARAYKDEVAWRAVAAGVRQPLLGRLQLDIQLFPHRPQDAATRIRKHGRANWDDDVACIDLGNCEKVVSDALQAAGVLADDKQLWRIALERMEPDGEARLVVTIRYAPKRVTEQGDLL